MFRILLLLLAGAVAPAANAQYPSMWPTQPWLAPWLAAMPQLPPVMPQLPPVMPVPQLDMPYMFWAVPQWVWVPVMPSPQEAPSWPPPLPPVPFQSVEEAPVAAPLGGVADQALPAAPAQTTPSPPESVLAEPEVKAAPVVVPHVSKPPRKKPTKAKPSSAGAPVETNPAKPRRLCWNNGVVDACPK